MVGSHEIILNISKRIAGASARYVRVKLVDQKRLTRSELMELEIEISKEIERLILNSNYEETVLSEQTEMLRNYIMDALDRYSKRVAIGVVDIGDIKKLVDGWLK